MNTMIKREYHYLIAGLPEIDIDLNKLSFSYKEFKNELKENLHPADYKYIHVLFLYRDNQNLLNLLFKKDEEFDDLANYSTDTLETEIIEPEELEDYIQKFILSFKDDKPIIPGISWENQLTALYYDYAINASNSLLKDWLIFEKNLKNIISAINARRFNKDIEKEVIGNDSIAESIRNNSTRDFGLSQDAPYIEKLLQLFENKSTIEREKEIDMMKWSFLDEKTTFEYFSIEKVIAYTIQLGIINRWLQLDPQTGKEMFDKLLSDLQNSLEFPNEFSLTK